MNVFDLCSDIDFPSSHCVLDEAACQRIECPEMFAARVEHFDLSVQSVPRVETFSVGASPSSLTADRAERLHAVQKRRLRN